MIPHESPSAAPAIRPSVLARHLLRQDFGIFMSALVDARGRSLEVADHHEVWCRLIAEHSRLALLAPRDHSKTTVALASILWRFYRHATDPTSGRYRDVPAGPYLAVLFSATQDQSQVLMNRFRDLLTANPWVVADLPRADAELARAAVSRTRIRLASGAELLVRSYGTSTRGLHPDLLILDDVLSDQNSGSEAQRDKTWTYFVSTLLPMHAKRILIVGTTLHAADLFHGLKPAESRAVFDFAWRRYRALDEATGTSLWPARHPPDELERIRDAAPTHFSREYQNDPRDDQSTYFPRALTQLAIDHGAGLTFEPWHRKQPGEYVVLGADLARSERIGADFTVVIVAAYDPRTRIRRVLTARRERGLDFEQQLHMFLDLATTYDVDIGFIERNGFQGWLVDELRKRPHGGVFFGHTTTGQRKMDFENDGIPVLKLALVHECWIMPSGDENSRRFARVWQSELAAFGWRNGRAEGSGEHDDTVIASWYVELARLAIDRAILRPVEEIITMEDLGIEPVRIGRDF